VRWGDMDEPWAILEIADMSLNVPVPELEGDPG
jgi:hypothetical protein